MEGTEALAALNTAPAGLTPDEARRRLAEYGPNVVTRGERRPAARIFLAQLTSPLVLVLITAAAVAGLLGETLDAWVILAIVGLNAVLAFVQEYRAERSLRALRRFMTHTATVRRQGAIMELPARDLVPGDIVCLEIGDIVPADLRLLVADELSTVEATLTGEALPVHKTTAPVHAPAGMPHELVNVAFMGTSIATGDGEGAVIATGGATFLGRTAGRLAERQPDTEFQRGMRRLSRFLFIVIIGMTAFVFLANALLGKGTFDSLLFAVALAVGITPEALPIIVTIALSRGALRMARDKLVVKRLMSVEDLGNVDVLCCDKTGTLTQGQVTLGGAVDPFGEADGEVLVRGVLASGRGGTMALDRALAQGIASLQQAPALGRYRVIDRNEFDFDRRRMSVLVAEGNRRTLIAKGSPESILAVSRHVWRKDRAEPLTDATLTELRRRAAAREADGYRVLAVAERELHGETSDLADETDLTLRGLLLFRDAPKSDAAAALHRLRHLGVEIRVLTGDSPTVARQVCRAVDLAIVEDRVVTGAELEALSPAGLQEYALRYTVFARLSPEQKHRMVSALSSAARVVGFLGDGVNDAPALRAADVGISVDSGADIAKEAADIVLLEKDLHVLARGITEGRRTFSNITKYVLNTISANFGNMTTVALSSLFLPFIPLLPSQILLNNFVSDLPLIAIPTDRVDRDLLRRPRHWDLGFVARFMLVFGVLSVAFDLTLIVVLIYVVQADMELFRTAWFVESACSEIIVTFAIRTRRAFFRSRPGTWLLVASVVTAGAALALPFTRLGQKYFAFSPLSAGVTTLVAGVLLAYFVTAEVAKRPFFRRLGQAKAG
jgi:Mg2+-importing ATPase